MTEAQFNRLLDLFERWLDSELGGPFTGVVDLRSEPRTDAQAPEPIPTPKRPRGRPRQPATESVAKETTQDEQTSYTCPYCKRILPSGVRDLHEPNCKQAAGGYASHQATPGKR